VNDENDFASDSTYTERFMGLPNLTDNYQGYNEGDLSKHVDQLKDKQFLLVSLFRYLSSSASLIPLISMS
jgi:hypothetical protein